MKGKLLGETKFYQIQTEFGNAIVREEFENGIETDTEVVEVEGKDIDKDLSDANIESIITTLEEALINNEIDF